MGEERQREARKELWWLEGTIKEYEAFAKKYIFRQDEVGKRIYKNYIGMITSAKKDMKWLKKRVS